VGIYRFFIRIFVVISKRKCSTNDNIKSECPLIKDVNENVEYIMYC
jgi:hypothetical protein